MKQLRSTKQLLGRAGERFLLLGMLAHNKEGKLCLEDQDGSVELDFSQLVSKKLRNPGMSTHLYSTGSTERRVVHGRMLRPGRRRLHRRRYP